jgi:hypothetical protein
MNDAVAKSYDLWCIVKFVVGIGETLSQGDASFTDDLEFSFYSGAAHGVCLVGDEVFAGNEADNIIQRLPDIQQQLAAFRQHKSVGWFRR